MDRTEILQKLKDFTLADYENLYSSYREWLVPEKVEASVHFPNCDDGIAAFIFRCNQPIDFNNIRRNNDLLIIVQRKLLGFKVYSMVCTADPYGPKDHIAHLSAQIYRANRGLHRGIPGRICLRSDFGFGTWIQRTDSEGDVIDINPASDKFTSAPGHFGINIHDTGGYYNSSLGCVIIAYNQDYLVFKSILENASNPSNVPVCVFDMEDLPEFLNDTK